MDRARASAPDDATRNEIERIEAGHRAFLAVEERVRGLFGADGANDHYRAAVDVAVDDLATAAGTVDERLATEITAARARLDDGADDARDHLRTLPVILLLGVVTALAAAVIGIQLRLREYR